MFPSRPLDACTVTLVPGTAGRSKALAGQSLRSKCFQTIPTKNETLSCQSLPHLYYNYRTLPSKTDGVDGDTYSQDYTLALNLRLSVHCSARVQGDSPVAGDSILSYPVTEAYNNGGLEEYTYHTHHFCRDTPLPLVVDITRGCGHPRP